MHSHPSKHPGSAAAAVSGTFLLLISLTAGTAAQGDMEQATGLDPAVMAGMLRDHFDIEHRSEV